MEAELRQECVEVIEELLAILENEGLDNENGPECERADRLLAELKR